MVQGATKKSTSALVNKVAKKQGKQDHKPSAKKARPTAEVRQRSIQQKLRATNIQHTETLMAARAGATGKLTIMKGLADKAQESGAKDKGKSRTIEKNKSKKK